MTKPARPGGRRTTMKDVARAAKVSMTTVSFVLNDVDGVSISQETRERVLETIEALHYRPNAAAATLRTNRTHSIGFVTDFIAASPFAGDIILGAQQAAWDAGQLLTIIHTGDDPGVTTAAIRMLIERRVDGIICSTLAHRHYQPPEIVREVPTVLLNCSAPDCSFPSVVPDEAQGGVLAATALLDAGHRRIGFLNFHNKSEPTITSPPEAGRLAGYTDALAAYGVDFDSDLVIPAGHDVRDGYDATRILLGRNLAPSAIFCGNDRIAMGAYQALADAGLRIPDDIAVVGYDDQTLISTNLSPALSTVALPFETLGREAVACLQAPLADEAPEQRVLPCHFVERQSIAGPPGRSGSTPRKEAIDA